MRRALLACAIAAFFVSITHALPLSHEEVTKLCLDAEDASHCGRLVEAVQMKRLPSLAVRDGNTLRVSLFPSGQATFVDVPSLAGGTSFALWDYISAMNAAVLWTTNDESSGFLLLQRATGIKTALPAEPIYGPDRQRLVTADLCPARCENKLVVWRVSREGVHRESEWTPGESWSDAGVRWKDADTLLVEYTPAGTEQSKTLERKLADAGWARR